MLPVTLSHDGVREYGSLDGDRPRGGLLVALVVPAIDLGMATLIGVVTLGGCFLWLSRISTLEALYGHDDIELPDSAWSTTPQAEWRSARRKRQDGRNPQG